LPNLVDRFVRGQSTQTAATGGADSLTLSTAQMPQHTHVVNDAGHWHNIPKYAGGPAYKWVPTAWGNNQATYSNNNHPTSTDTTGITLDDAGSSNSFDNRPAFIEMQYIIKT